MAGEIYFSNLAGNFDYQQILDQMQYIKSQQIFLLQERESIIQQKKDAVANYRTLIKDIQGIFEDLVSPTLFAEKSVSISDETAISVTITDPTKVSESNLDISVTQLAKNDVWLTGGGVSDKDTAITSLSSGSLTVSYQGTDYTVSYDNTDSLQSIVDKLNTQFQSSNANLSASIFFDGINYRLMVKGLDTGSGNTVTITDSLTGTGSLTDALGGFNNVQTAQNAQISIYGTTVESSTNTFNSVLPGVVIEAKSTTSSPVNVTIGKNYQPFKDKLQEFVNKYNEIVDFVQTNTSKEGVLSGDYTLQSIRSQIFNGLTPLMELGIINVDKDTGHISINNTELDNKLQTDPSTVQTKISDLDKNLRDYFYSVLDPYGPLKSKEKGYDKQIEAIEKKIEIDTKRIDAEIEILRKQFIALQVYMAEMEDLRLRLSSLFTNQTDQTQ